MNLALMTKWIWRMLTEDDIKLLWLQLLKAKYPVDRFFSTSPVGGSPFWHSLHKLKAVFKQGARFFPGNNSDILFWTDHWTEEEALSVRYPRLFQICADPEITVERAYEGDGWRIFFRRSFGQEESNLWLQMVQDLEEVVPGEGRDKVLWKLEASGRFSVKSLYNTLIKGHASLLGPAIWRTSIPTKIKIFLWQLSRGRLPSNDQILKRRGPSDGLCALCGLPENVDHIFFRCDLALFVWAGIRDMLGVTWNPSCFSSWERCIQSLNDKLQRSLRVLFAAICWALWKIRNKFTIAAKFPSQPANCFFLIRLNLQLWRPLQRSKEEPLLTQLEAMLKTLFDKTCDPPQPRRPS
jgi:hypothetical protein